MIAEELKISPATLSFHLKELTHAGLLPQRHPLGNLYNSMKQRYASGGRLIPAPRYLPYPVPRRRGLGPSARG
jgi:DNA-binding transcriptional ArsR family regulator